MSAGVRARNTSGSRPARITASSTLRTAQVRQAVDGLGKLAHNLLAGPVLPAARVEAKALAI
jgi:hypothetical protein